MMNGMNGMNSRVLNRERIEAKLHAACANQVAIVNGYGTFDFFKEMIPRCSSENLVALWEERRQELYSSIPFNTSILYEISAELTRRRKRRMIG
jgi:hypothetical protein